MKTIKLLFCSALLCMNAFAQTVEDPSTDPNYDPAKTASIPAPPAPGAALVTDSGDYQPGSLATITGSGFQAGETVTLQVLHADGTPATGEDHDPWDVTANTSGGFTTTWSVCTDDCLGSHLVVVAEGQTSNLTAEFPFTDAQPTSTCWIPVDNTYSTFAGNDDASIGPFALPFTFNLYGTNYTQVWINNNGNLTFTGPFGAYTASGFPFNVPMVAPFWGDVMTTCAATVKYKISATKVIVTWDGVGYYFNNCSKLNTFQVIITNGNDASIGIGNNVAFYYKDMQWTTGDASGGSGGFGGTPATVGINKGSSGLYVQVGRFGLNSSAYDGGGGATDGINYLDNECFLFNVSNVANQPPSVSGVPESNTVNVQCGTTQTFTLTFLPPEVGQSVSVAVNTGGLCGTTVTTTSGSVATATVSITEGACNAGPHVITFTATDNYPQPASTVVNVTVNVATCCIAPVITCPTVSPASVNTSSCSALVSFAATATGTSPTITYSQNSGTAFPLGTTTVTATATNSCGTDVCTFNVAVTSDLAINAGGDEQTYYGYNMDQTVNRTVTATGGGGGYSYSWSLSRPMRCNIVNSIGDEIFNSGTCTNNACPAAPDTLTAAAPSCTNTTGSVTAKLIDDADLYVTVTDQYGCTARDTFHINSIDARCFAGNSSNYKIYVCHRTSSNTNPWVQICIAQPAVPTHLAENNLDCIGLCPCGTRLDNATASSDFGMAVYPNPTSNNVNVEFDSETSGAYELTMFDITGRVVLNNTGSVYAGGNRIALPIRGIAEGIYNLRLSIGDKSSSVRLVVK